jgi:hypothetical protein
MYSGVEAPNEKESRATMGRIAAKFLDCVVYIYPDKQAADSDERVGGSGFIVARQVVGGFQTFIITNRHVIKDVPNPVIRLNRRGGGLELFPTNLQRWTHHPEGDDISAIQIDVSAEDHDQAWIGLWSFVNPEIVSRFLGLGSDVAMLGRYSGIDGKLRNSPTARFGSIASSELITERNAMGNSQETFVVDCHSVPGYSGSPVIAYLPTTAASERAVENSGLGPWLLGIDWMHFDDHEPVRNKVGIKSSDGLYVKANSGLAGVIPAWRILGLINEFEAPA